MIYLQYSETIQKSLGYPEIGSINKNSKYEELRFKEKALADYIFIFRGDKTVYMKNRQTVLSEGHQFTEEERLIILLKAVPL